MNGMKYLYISPTNICNHNCHICAHHDYMRKEKGHMSMELFKKIVDEIPESVETIYLHKQGESSLNPNLPKMMQWLNMMKPNIKVKLNTNLVKFNDDLAKAYSKYIDVLTVSFHSINKDIYKKLHGSDTFDKVIKHLEAIKQIRDNTDSKMELWIDYVWQNGNKNEKKSDIINFFKELLGENVTINFWWCINFLDMGTEGNLKIYDKIPDNMMPFCIFPWTMMTICWDGNVDYCFVDPKESVFFGNLHENSIEEIWNGSSYELFRKVWLQRDLKYLKKCNFRCKMCSFLWSEQTQDYTQLVPDLCKKFTKNWNKNKKLYKLKLKEEGKTLKSFYGKRVKI